MRRAAPHAAPADGDVLFGAPGVPSLIGHTPDNAAYWRGFLEQRSTALVANLSVRAGIITHESMAYPISVCDRSEGNAYPSSLEAQYVSYPLAELGLVSPYWLRAAARVGLHALGLAMRVGQMDRVAQWNSWLLSTNLTPESLPSAIESVTERMLQLFPTHALLLKNVTARERPELPRLLQEAGYELITSRQVYFFDGRTAPYLQKETVKRERKLLQDLGDYQPMEHADFTSADTPRVAELYRLLYLEKHSQLNPQYTERFVAGAIRERWLEFRGLRHASGRVDAVMGCFRMGGTTSTPFIGYDTSLPPKPGLYRILVAMLLQRVAEEKLLLNYSSGAGEFKRRRGGEPVIEFNAVYTRHLPPWRRAGFRTLGEFSNRFGRRFLEANQI